MFFLSLLFRNKQLKINTLEKRRQCGNYLVSSILLRWTALIIGILNPAKSVSL